MINIDISTSQGVSYAGGTFSPTVTYENTTYGGVVPPVCPDWITFEYIGGAQEGDNYVESYRFSVEPNDGVVRNGTIALQCTDTSGNTWNNYITVTQGSGEIVEAPIWKDTFYYAAHTDVFRYSIKNADGVNIYYGKAYCAPGDGGPYVQVNKICQNYLRQNLGDFRELFNSIRENEGAYADFSLCGVNESDPDSESVELMNYRFLFDWAGAWTGEGAYTMTEPINGHIDPRMWLMYTEYNKVPREVTVNINDDGVPGGGDSGFTEILNVIPTAVTVYAYSGMTGFIVESNLNWEVTSYDPVFEVTGKTNDMFYVKFDTNTGNTRSGYLIVRNIGGGTKWQRVEITQLSLQDTPIDPTGTTIPSNVLLISDYASTDPVFIDRTQAGEWYHTWSLPQVWGVYDSGVCDGFGANYVGFQMDFQWRPTEWLDASGNPYTFTALIFDGPITAIPDYKVLPYKPEDQAYVGPFVSSYWLLSNSVVLPSGVTYIGDESLGSTNYIEWPASLDEIGDGGLGFGPKAYSALTIPNTISKLGDGAFAYGYSTMNARPEEWSDYNPKSVYVPASVNEMGKGVFEGCVGLVSASVATAYIGSLPEATFSRCRSLNSVSLPNGLTGIGKRAFYGCIGLTNVTLPNSVETIGDQAFSMDIAYSEIGISASYDTTAGPSSITLPSGLKKIGVEAFFDCALTSISIPASVTEIGGGAFQCSGLTDIYCYATTAPTLVPSTRTMGTGNYAGSASSPIWATRDSVYADWDVPTTVIHIPAGADYSSWKALAPMSQMTFVEDL